MYINTAGSSTHHSLRNTTRWRWASLSIGATLGNLERGSFTRAFEIRMKGVVGMESFSLKKLSA